MARAARRRYIVCRNQAEATKNAAARQAILEHLAQTLGQGDTSLVGNRG